MDDFVVSILGDGSLALSVWAWADRWEEGCRVVDGRRGDR